LPNSMSKVPSASGVITLSIAVLVRRGICTLTIILASMQTALTRKRGQFFEMYRQIRVRVPICVDTFLDVRVVTIVFL